MAISYIIEMVDTSIYFGGWEMNNKAIITPSVFNAVQFSDWKAAKEVMMILNRQFNTQAFAAIDWPY